MFFRYQVQHAAPVRRERWSQSRYSETKFVSVIAVLSTAGRVEDCADPFNRAVFQAFASGPRLRNTQGVGPSPAANPTLHRGARRMALILAVDPEQRQQAALACLARELNDHELLSAASCADALEALDRRTPDLVLLPALLPEAEESELLSNLRSRAGSDVQALTMPPLKLPDTAPPAPQASVHPAWLNQILHPQDDATEQAGEECEPAVFAELIRSYLWPVEEAVEAVGAVADAAKAVAEQRRQPLSPPRRHGRGSGIVVNAGTIARLRSPSAHRPGRVDAGSAGPSPWWRRRSRCRPSASAISKCSGGVVFGPCRIGQLRQPRSCLVISRTRRQNLKTRVGRCRTAIAFLKTLKDLKKPEALIPWVRRLQWLPKAAIVAVVLTIGATGPGAWLKVELGTQGQYAMLESSRAVPGPGGRSGDGVDSADGDAPTGTHRVDFQYRGKARTIQIVITQGGRITKLIDLVGEDRRPAAGQHRARARTFLVDNVSRGVTR